MSFSDPLLTKAEVADMIRCTERTVERLVKKKMFPGPMRIGKEVNWFESAVHRWLDMQRLTQLDWHPPSEKRPRAGNPVVCAPTSGALAVQACEAPSAAPMNSGLSACHLQMHKQSSSSFFTAEQIAASDM